MNAPSGTLAELRVNPNWAKLPLYDLKGWRRLAFGELAESVNERVEPSEAADETYVGLDDLEPEELNVRTWGKGSDVIGTKLRFRKGDIIFGRRRAYQRKLAVADFDGICSAHAMVVRAKQNVVLSEFLPFLMMSDRFMKRAMKISVGSLSPTINWTTLKLEEFDLPPLEQQRRITRIFTGLRTLIENWQNTLHAMDTAANECLKTLMLGGKSLPPSSDISAFTVPRSWSVRSAADLVDSPITKGATPSEKLNTVSATIPFLKVYNLTFSGQLDFSVNPTYVEPMAHQTILKRSQVRPGDVLMNIVGPPLGKTALVPESFQDANINQAIAIYRIADPELRIYFAEYLRSNLAQLWLERRSKKTSGQRNLTLQLAQELPVPIPPRSVMRKVIETSQQFATCSKDIRDALAAVICLRRAISRQVFGE